MSVSNILGSDGKIVSGVLPNPYPFPPAVSVGFGDVLAVNNSAANPVGGAPQSATDLDNVGAVSVETSKLYQGNFLALQIGEAGDNLQIKGATAKGSILVGNGVNTEELVVPAGPPNPNGSVLILDDTQPLGVRWGGESGPIATITPGNNIDILGTSANPIVAFQSPTTSDIVLGVGTKIEAKDDYTTPIYTMSLDATGLNDTYLSGAVENKEDIAVSSTSVIDTISTTDGGSYLNTNITTCNTSGVSDTKTSSNLSTSNVAQASISCNATGATPSAQMGVGVSAPTTPPFPDITASVSMGCSDTTNPTISLSQSAPFAISYITTLDINGINQNNTGGVAGFTINTNTQPLALTTNDNITFTADNIDLDATGRLIVPSLASGDYLDYNAGSLKIVNDSVAGSANPLLVLQNNNNTAGATTFETYKNDQPTSTGGDNIASWSATCNTNVGKTEISRVNHIAYGTGASNNDGGIALSCKVNSAITNFLICNGGANNAIGSGEVQVFKPITTTSPNNLNLICPTAGGTAKIQSASNIELEATGDNLTTISGANTTISTTGVGSQIEFKPEATAGKIVFTGASLQSGSSSGNSGEHLVIYLNGVKYHIALQTP